MIEKLSSQLAGELEVLALERRKLRTDFEAWVEGASERLALHFAQRSESLAQRLDQSVEASNSAWRRASDELAKSVAEAVQGLQSTTDASLRNAKANLGDLISQAEQRYATLADKLASALSTIEESASRLNRELETLAREKSQLYRDLEVWVQEAHAREAPREERVSDLNDRMMSAERRVEQLERQVKRLESEQWQSAQKLSSVEERLTTIESTRRFGIRLFHKRNAGPTP